MVKFLVGLVIVLHGLVHLWYVVLSQKLVAYRPEMGWTGRSWLFTPLLGDPTTRGLAAIFYSLAAVALVMGGIGIYTRSTWGLPVLVGSAVLSAAVIILFWDGRLERLAERGLVGLVISLVLVGTAGATTRYQGEMRTAQARLDRMGSRVITTACGPIEYARIEPEALAGDPVLVIHGNGGGFDQGVSLAHGFLGPDVQAIVPSRFGYLRSPLPAEASVAMQADALACLMDALYIDRATVFATSAGVTSAVQLALRHPERFSGLILLSPNAPAAVGLTPMPKLIFRTLMRSDFTFWALKTYLPWSVRLFVGVPKGFTLTPEHKAEVEAALSSILPVSPRAEGMVFDTYVSNPEINDFPLGDVHTPTLVISAVDDPMALHAGARILAEEMPNTRLVAVADGGHLLLGHTEEVRAEIAVFLRNRRAEQENNQ